ncbi:uncharacterized protein LOC142338051 [Convolutriloba macropyga]|uniref:uncharacterized protein LOC142338051 n=1 Tax=Convolutriloba macropyga TaxID=536237 RepID=UPI003F527680
MYELISVGSKLDGREEKLEELELTLGENLDILTYIQNTQLVNISVISVGSKLDGREEKLEELELTLGENLDILTYIQNTQLVNISDQFTQIQSTWIDLQSSIDAQLLNDVTALEEKTINEIELLHNKSQENNSDIMSTDLAAAQIRFLAQMTATLKNNLMSVEKEIAEFHERSDDVLKRNLSITTSTIPKSNSANFYTIIDGIHDTSECFESAAPTWASFTGIHVIWTRSIA